MQEIQKMVFGICSLTIAMNKDEKLFMFSSRLS